MNTKETLTKLYNKSLRAGQFSEAKRIQEQYEQLVVEETKPGLKGIGKDISSADEDHISKTKPVHKFKTGMSPEEGPTHYSVHHHNDHTILSPGGEAMGSDAYKFKGTHHSLDAIKAHVKKIHSEFYNSQ